MDSVKKRGPKSKAKKTAAALDVAFAAAADVAEQVADSAALESAASGFKSSQVVEGVQRIDGFASIYADSIPPAIDSIDLVALQADSPAADDIPEATPSIHIELPDYLRECAVPLDSLVVLPVDARARIESELGCRFDLKDGAVRAHDGRLFRIEHDHDAHALELIGA